MDAQLSAQRGSQNITAFAAHGPHGEKLAIFNKAAAPVTVKLAGKFSGRRAAVVMLQGPSIDSRDGVTLGGSQVGADGSFHPHSQARVKLHDGATLEVPAYTAACIEA